MHASPQLPVCLCVLGVILDWIQIPVLVTESSSEELQALKQTLLIWQLVSDSEHSHTCEVERGLLFFLPAP